MKKKVKKIIGSTVLTSILFTTVIPTSLIANALIRPENKDSRIAPNQVLELNSDNEMLNQAFANSTKYIYDELVVGPVQYPNFDPDRRITMFPENGVKAMPAYWGTYHGVPGEAYRESFCLRDIGHQVMGASKLSLNEETYSMLNLFASDALKDKQVDVNAANLDPKDPWASAVPKTFWQQYWTKWAYNFYGVGHYMDGYYPEIPAPFELLDKVEEMYKATGDERWISDTFLNFGRQLQNDFLDIYDYNGNGIVDNRSMKGIFPGFWEFEGTEEVAEEYITLDTSTNPNTLRINKEYFKNLNIQDLTLNVDLKNGKKGILSVRVDNVKRKDGTKPLVNHDYMLVNSNSKEFSDINLTMNIPNGIKLDSLKDGNKTLTLGVDYTVSGKTVTIKKEYIKSICDTKDRNIKSGFTFNFSDGKNHFFVLELSNYEGDGILDKSSVTLDFNNMQDVVLKVTNPENKPLEKIGNTMTRVTESGDALGTQYKSLLALESMVRARAKIEPQNAAKLNKEADGYKAKAEYILNEFRTNWYDEETGLYARALDGFGNPIYDWGHEGSFFMPIKELLEPGEKSDNYLDFIQYNSFTDPLNEEAITYLPEAFYNYGKNAQGWYWLQYGLRRFYNVSDSQMIKTYPEIAFLNVENTLGFMMGVNLNVPQNQVETFSRLTKDVGYVNVKNIPVGQGSMSTDDYKRDIKNLIDVRHDGTTTTSFANQGGSKNTLIWKAKFEGNHDYIYVDGVKMKATKEVVNGQNISYVKVNVSPGQTKKATVLNESGLVENVDGFLSLSDMNYAFASGKVELDKSIKNNSILLNKTTFQKGLGTDGNTTLRYYLNGNASRFTSTVGLDDVRDYSRNNGSVNFKVYVDGIVKFESGAMTKDTPNKFIDIDLTNAKVIDLVTIDAGGNIYDNSATWAEPKVYTSINQLPNLSDNSIVFLGDATPISVKGTVVQNKGLNSKYITIDGVQFEKGLSVSGNTETVFDTGNLFKTFEAALGVSSDNNAATDNSLTFKVFVDNNTNPIYSTTIKESERIVPVSLNIENATTIKIVTEGNTSGVLADSKIIYKSGVDLGAPNIVARKITKIDNPELGDKKLILPIVPEGYSIRIKSSSNPSLIDLNGNITTPDVDESSNLVLEVKRLSKGDVADTIEINVVVLSDKSISLSTLDWISATTGSGEVKKDKSIDGNPLKIGEKTYAKGIGTHADSTIIYNLDGKYSKFAVEVGVDEEVRENGSLEFKIYGDGKLLASSGILKGFDDPKRLFANIDGVKELKLVATDAGDGINCDHANWANPQLALKGTSLPTEEVKVSSLKPVTATTGWGQIGIDKSVDNNPIKIDGKVYDSGLGVHADSDLVYSLDGKYKSFKATVGLDDEVGSNGSVIFEVYLDGVKAFDSGVMTGDSKAKDINLSVVGVKEIKLSVRGAGDGINFDHADWGNPVLLTEEIVVPETNCDVNGDGVIDVLDLAMVAARYNCKNSDPSYAKEFDLNSDGIIDLYDLVTISKNIN